MNYIATHISGKRVDYVDVGVGKTILFIHGYGVTPQAYAEDISQLSTSYRVIAPKLHKFGNTKQRVHILQKLINHLEINHVVVIGHSASGVLAVLLAYTYPQHIAGLILVDSMGIAYGRNRQYWIRYWITHVLGLAKRSGKRSYQALLSLASDFLYETIRHPKASYEQAQFVTSVDVIPYLHKLTIPVLILWGKQDDLTPVADSFVFLQEAKHVELDIVNGNHDWLKLHPRVFAEKVDTFMEKLADSSRRLIPRDKQ
jgi:pimeloyl-ACP methyl ester carboxylesterase